MNNNALVLKNPRGWFAAGAEVQNAMELLGDGAFRLFMYLCLNARRDTGVLEGSLTQLAKNVKRAQHTVRLYLREMESAGICCCRFGHSPLGSGMVEINEAFWPYQRSEQDQIDVDFTAFIGAIRKMLQARACVNVSASAADEILAREWRDRGIRIEIIEQAIMVGCIRKYVSWRNNQSLSMIGSLKYFAPVLEEVLTMKDDPDYWACLRYRLTRLENVWIRTRPDGASHVREKEVVSDLELT